VSDLSSLKAKDLPLTRTLTLGGMRVHALEAGVFWLDGGGMFGVVPRPLWEKKIPPDPRNRIALALRCLLVEAPHALVLVDSGVGSKESESFREIYGLDNAGSPTRLEDGMRALGFEPRDVDLVVCTHLHFDHVGGNVVHGDDGKLRPAFPRARHIVQRGELEFAGSSNERIRASYMTKNIAPVLEAGLMDTVEGAAQVTEGVRLLPTPGHTPNHQSVVLESGGEVAVFLADVCPTSAHLPLPWVMGHDLEPLRTLESKRGLWERAKGDGWRLVFQHDATLPWGRLDPQEERPVLLVEEDGP
jgi:glyoxylase-like metal-dependent hydrolase (beta-lactamase superfamily II)